MVHVSDLKAEYKNNPLGLGCTCPRLFWNLISDVNNTLQTAYRVQCATMSEDLLRGENLLWDSGQIESDNSIHIEYQGAQLASQQRVYWRVKVWDNHGNESPWSEMAWWETGLLNPSEWTAQWIEPALDEDVTVSTPAPYLRKDFNLNKTIQQARIYASARGVYELSLNGQKVGNDLFTPGWTTYQKRIQYQTFDVTQLLQNGKNTFGAILGDGWFRGYFVWQGNKNLYGEKTALIAQLVIQYTDGTTETVATDESWKCNTGPIVKSDIYNGETYDARLEQNGWNKPGFDDLAWFKVDVKNYSKEILIASEGEPVQVTQEIIPIEKIITPKGEIVFDLGQNMVGWMQFSLNGNAGDQIVLDHGEVLDQEGNFYNANLRAAKAQDVYCFKGEGTETWEPRFTFHGFRYVRISGYNGEIDCKNLVGKVIHSNMEAIGDFTCSDPLINQLQQNIDWGLRGNFLDIPTDCPQRDERLGWTGDAQVFAPTASFIRNTASFYTKWMKDFPLEQKTDGSVPWVVPNVVKDGGGTGWSDGFGATGWADAAIVIPWTVYETYGDVRILENQYESMRAWEEYMIRNSGERCIFDYGFHFGDWLSFAEYMSYKYNAPDYGYAGAYTEKELIATAYFYYSTGLMEKIANILGKTDDAKRYAELRPRIKAAFQKEFMTQTGRLTSNSQTAYVLALSFGLYNDEMEATGAKRLADDVMHFEHLTTGFLGTPLLCQALSNHGYPNLAFMLLFNKRYPSWLYPITQGATTIWERWDCIKPDGSFQTVGMNSFNHYAYGAVGNWLYTQVAGIQTNPTKPGYKHMVIRPLITNRLTYAEASHKSLYGLIRSRWETQDNQLKMKVEIPANTTATIYVPTCSAEVLENGKPVSEHNSRYEKGYLCIELGSGKYEFQSKI